MATLLIFLLILSLLVFVHELGHFVTAKKAGITVEEFGIGYPPRAMRIWQDLGKITLNGQEMVIGRRTKIPRKLEVGSKVIVETKTRPDGRPEVTKINLVSPDENAGAERETKSILAVESLEKPTVYSLNWIPFGGFVKMLGEEDPTAPGSFASKSKKARLTVLFAGAAMNLITAFVVFTLMYLTGQPEPIGPTYITEVTPNSPAEQAGIQANDFVLMADDTPIESASDLVEYTQAHKGEEVTLTLLRGNKELRLSLVPRENPPPNEGAMGIGIHTQYTQLRLKELEPNSPAALAGLQPEDIILSVNGKVAELPEILNQQLIENGPTPVNINFQRGEDIIETTLTPNEITPSDNAGETAFAGLVETPVPALGAVVLPELMGQRVTSLPLGQAAWRGATTTAGVIIQTFTVPIAVAKNLIPAEQARPVGPVGIYQITDSAVVASRESNVIYPILFLTAILSAALAVTNLLPLPALDGGRIFFIIIEAIRGKRISPEKEGAIHFIGLALLFTLMLVISFYDITDPVDVSGLFR